MGRPLSTVLVIPAQKAQGFNELPESPHIISHSLSSTAHSSAPSMMPPRGSSSSSTFGGGAQSTSFASTSALKGVTSTSGGVSHPHQDVSLLSTNIPLRSSDPLYTEYPSLLTPSASTSAPIVLPRPEPNVPPPVPIYDSPSAHPYLNPLTPHQKQILMRHQMLIQQRQAQQHAVNVQQQRLQMQAQMSRMPPQMAQQMRLKWAQQQQQMAMEQRQQQRQVNMAVAHPHPQQHPQQQPQYYPSQHAQHPQHAHMMPQRMAGPSAVRRQLHQIRQARHGPVK
ncbi:hypothetical protein ADUPG1_014116 [Aduncisulcus paluster]|uniref:Uncharacterized protein n=1 Tax=Aduncisulcus paluster TaxID=2918883 RepID=A0ABQ5KAR7_9EUKA|nr:hypothetical protein ADUPG1_014116 [Aduncisulcus paluster]